MDIGWLTIDFGKSNWEDFECDLLPRIVLIKDDVHTGIVFGWLLWGVIIAYNNW